VPVFTETLEKQDRDKVWQFASNMFSFLSLTLAALVATGILLASLALVILPLSPRIALILNLLQIMLPYMFLYLPSRLFFSAILNSLRRFVLPAATPVAMNIVMIAALFLVCPFVAGGRGLAHQGRSLERHCRRCDPGRDAVAPVGPVRVPSAPLNGLAGPARAACLAINGGHHHWGRHHAGECATQWNCGPLNRTGESFLPILCRATDLSSLGHFCHRAGYDPVANFFRSRCTGADRSRPRYIKPFAAPVDVYHAAKLPRECSYWPNPLVRLVYERGAFSAFSTDMTTLAVQCYAPGLVVFSLLKVLIPVFYAPAGHENTDEKSAWPAPR